MIPDESQIQEAARRLIQDALSVVASRRVKPSQQPALSPTSRRRLDPWSPITAGNLQGGFAVAARSLHSGQTSCMELLEQSLAAAEGDTCNAFSELTPGNALVQAVALDEELANGRIRGPLHGIPISIKDVLDVAGVPTRAGSDAYNETPQTDAPSVALLRDAGAVLMGKTQPHEFALGLITPQSRNPHDELRIPGGSSGGSAIAVATGMGLASLGTDTRGSIRVPAALCGVVGLKPTFGSVPGGGLVQLAWSMDHIGPLTTTVADAAVMLDVLAGSALARACGARVAGLRVGVPPDGCSDADPAVVAVFSQAVGLLGSLTGELTEVRRPTNLDFSNANAVSLVTSRPEAASYHRRLGLDRSKYGPATRAIIDVADAVSATDYLDAQRLRALIADQMSGVFDEVDVLVMPTTLIPAPQTKGAIAHSMVLARNVTIWSLIGFPAISVPCGKTPTGLPVGLQIVAPPFEEASLIALGSAFELARDS